jgi:hypothetical protein
MSSCYEVENVLARRIAVQDGAYERQYRTKWKNFSHNRNSWEPTDNFHGLKIIQEFESQRNKLIEKALHPRYGTKENTQFTTCCGFNGNYFAASAPNTQT